MIVKTLPQMISSGATINLPNLYKSYLIGEMKRNNPVLFRHAINDQTLKFLKELEPDQSTLIKWIQSTRDGQMRNSRLGGNTATLLVKISHDSLSGQDLSGTNLSGVNFFGADLRNSNLRSAMLTQSVVGRAKFYETTIQGAKFGNTHVSFHIIKSGETRNYDLDEFIDLVGDKLLTAGHDIGLAYFEKAGYRPDLFWEVSIPLSDVSELERMRDLLSNLLDTEVAVFWDEFEQLERQADSKKLS